jgi:site-specific DNA-methyltransferase (adenine-specific)
MVSLKKITQEARRGVYEFAPIQDFTEPWTDEKLYKKYGLTEDEIAFIESMIRPMDLSQNGELDE